MPLDAGKIRVLCFDLDGTISDTDDLYVQRAARYLTPFAKWFPGFSPLNTARRLVMGMETPGNTIYRVLDQFHLDRFMYVMRGYLRPRVDPKSKPEYMLIPGVSEMLADLRQHYPLALVSAREYRSTLDFLNHFELTGYFATIVTGETTRFAKPHPDPLLYVSEKLAIPTGSMLMIGDTVVDILTGKAAGSQTVGVLCGFGMEKELRRAGADLILEKTTHLPIALQ